MPVFSVQPNGRVQPRRHPLEIQTTLQVYYLGAYDPTSPATSTASGT